jgi:hypothetical protein
MGVGRVGVCLSAGVGYRGSSDHIALENHIAGRAVQTVLILGQRRQQLLSLRRVPERVMSDVLC